MCVACVCMCVCVWMAFIEKRNKPMPQSTYICRGFPFVLSLASMSLLLPLLPLLPIVVVALVATVAVVVVVVLGVVLCVYAALTRMCNNY